MKGYNTYVGARYVPIFDGEWDNSKAYEPLVIVSHEGNSYTSKTYVPIGASINNDKYWAITGNYNAQVEVYRQQVVTQKNRLDKLVEENYANVKDYGAKGDGSTDDTEAFILASSHGIVYVPDGTYLVENLEEFSGHFVGDNATIQLTGDGVINEETNFTHFENIKFNCGIYSLFKGICRYITFDNCSFEGTGVLLDGSVPNWSGVITFNKCIINIPVVDARALNHIAFNECIIADIEYLVNASNCESCSITNCDVEHVIDLIKGNTISSVNISGSYIEWTTLINVSNCQNALVEGNWIYGSDNNRDLAYATAGPGGVSFIDNRITLMDNNIVDVANSPNMACKLITSNGALKNNTTSIYDISTITSTIFNGVVIMNSPSQGYTSNLYSKMFVKHTTTVTTNNNGSAGIASNDPILFADCSNGGVCIPWKRNNGKYEIVVTSFGTSGEPGIVANTEVTINYYTFSPNYVSES